MMNYECRDFLQFLDNSPSNYHAVANLVEMLEKEGYQQLLEHEQWKLEPEGKYYLTRGGTAVIAFRIPSGMAKGFMMSASHTDRPTFKVKENGQLVGAYTRLATEPYGGMLMATWLDRPLSVAGRVMVETEQGVESRLINIDRDLMLIPNMAIHMNRQANDGFKWNPAVDTIPLLGSKEAVDQFWTLVEQEAGGKVLGSDLYLYIRQKATVWGVADEYFSSAAIDDLECVWGCARGFLDARPSEAIPVFCAFDCEEVGSGSPQGAAATMLRATLERICAGLNRDLYQMLAQSFMISADNAHGIHPNHPEFADPNNAPVPGQGVVMKFNAAQRYTTDGASAAVFRKICGRADVPVQTYCNRADIRGGSTLGNISLSQVTVPSADIGLAQLAMHSSYETAAVRDIAYLAQAMTEYYSTALTAMPDGGFTVE